MPLINHPKSTENSTAARRSNGRKSRGATTAEGKERIRAANLKHGYYSKVREEALVALGEDPKELAALIAGAHEQFQPANAYQADLVNQLAGLRWRMRRAERAQESAMVRKIQAVEARRHGTASQLRYRWVDISDFLGILRLAVGRTDYYTHPGLIERCVEVMKINSSPGMRDILQLLYILRKPRRFAEEMPPPMADAMTDRDWDTIDDLYDEGAVSKQPHPEIAVAEGAERDPLRADLRERIELEIRLNNESWGETIAEAEAPLSIIERDRLAIAVQKENTLIRLEESTCFREFWRLGTILTKLREDEGNQESGVGSQEANFSSQKAGVRSRESEVGGPMSEDGTPGFESGTSAPTGEPPITHLVSASLPPDTSDLTPLLKNEGDSGDVDENKGVEKQVPGVRCRVPEVRNQISAVRRQASQPEIDPEIPAAGYNTRNVAA